MLNVTLPDDYGTGPGGQPSCDFDTDCLPSVRCVTPLAGGDARCRILDGMSFRGCGDAVARLDGLCPSVSGYTCGPLDTLADGSQKAFCEGGMCATDADCLAAYPVTGLDCVQGRCSTLCTSNADCVVHPAQTQCLSSNAAAPLSGLSGLCVAGSMQAQLFTYRLSRTTGVTGISPLSGQKNLVFVAEGYTQADLPSFRTRVEQLVENTIGHTDVVSPLVNSLFNVFVLVVEDRFSGVGAPTRFGVLSGTSALNDQTLRSPGFNAQALFFLDTALDEWSEAHGMPSLDPRGDYEARGVVLFRAGTGRANSNLGAGLVFQPDEDDDDVLRHELGHLLIASLDEYTGDQNLRTVDFEDDGNRNLCWYNMASRRLLTNCSRCDGSDDGEVTATRVNGISWAPFLNDPAAIVGGFSSGDGREPPIRQTGFFLGGLGAYPLEMFRPTATSIMRHQWDTTLFNRASIEGGARWNVPDDQAATMRWAPVEAPAVTPTGNGPLQAVAMSEKHHRTFWTFREQASGSDFLSIMEGSSFWLERKVRLPSAPGADTPRVLVIDDLHDKLYMRSRASDPEDSRLIVLDTRTGDLSTVGIPHLFGFPGVAPFANPLASTVFVQTRDPSDVFQMVKVQGDVVTPIAAPTNQPLFSGVPLTSGNNLFFVAGSSLLGDEFCNPTECQVWVLDTRTDTFFETPLRVDMTGEAFPPGIQLAAVAPRRPLTNVLILVTRTRVLIYTTDAIVSALTNGQNPEPDSLFIHNLGFTGFLSAVAYADGPGAFQDRVLIGNQNGDIAAFDPDGANVEFFRPRFRQPGMQVIGLLTAPVMTRQEGYALAALGGFDGPRNGVVAVLDLKTDSTMLDPERGRVLFEQPVAALGLSSPGLAWDHEHGWFFSTGVVDVGGPGPNRFRTAVVRGPNGLRHQGCPIFFVP